MPERSLPVPLACDMSAVPAAERAEHQRVTRYLVTSATDIQKFSDGFAFQLSAGDYETAVRFITLERLCYPFLRFALEVTPGRGPVWLRVEGPPGAGEFLRAELHLP